MWIFKRWAAGLAATAALLPWGPVAGAAAAPARPGDHDLVRAAQAALARATGDTPVVSAQESGSAGLIAVGGHHTCAVVQYEDLWCWGADDQGQLGDGAATGDGKPVRVNAAGALASAAGVVGVRAGRVHTCALAFDYEAEGLSVHCWGGNDEGQLGDGSFTSRARPVLVAADVAQVATGSDHTCVLSVELTVSCWGRNNAGQLGDGTAGTSEANPRLVPGLSGIVDLAAGGDTTCALRQDGKAWCWGSGSHGQLGDGRAASGNPAPSPVAVAGGPYGEISVGRRHVCALGPGGAAYCWGAGERGQVGGSTDRSTPRRVGRRAYAAVRAGGDSSCGITGRGVGYCWGANNAGQLGVGDSTDRSRPAVVDRSRIRTSTLARLVLGAPAPLLTTVAVGETHSCAVDVSSSLYCTRGGVLRAVPLAPGPVTGVRVAPRTGGLRVRWTAPAGTGGGPIGTYLAVALTGRDFDDLRTCAAQTALTCTITGLREGRPYTVLVAATSHGGSSYSALAYGTPAAAGPGAGLPVTGPGPFAALGVALLTAGWSLFRASGSVSCRHGAGETTGAVNE